LDYWEIAASIGSIIFLVSAFLPLITITVLDTTASISLIDLYSALTNARGQTARDITMLIRSYGILLTILLYPATVILSFVSIAKRKAAFAAGTLGIVCWLGPIIALSSLQALQYTGLGIYVGFLGAIILLVASALKPTATKPQAAATLISPPPAQP
jgi:amino acid permease